MNNLETINSIKNITNNSYAEFIFNSASNLIDNKINEVKETMIVKTIESVDTISTVVNAVDTISTVVNGVSIAGDVVSMIIF